METIKELHDKKKYCGDPKCVLCCGRFMRHSFNPDNGNMCDHCDYDGTPDLIDSAEYLINSKE